MSTGKQTKINRLLQSQPSGVVFLTSWMELNGYSRELQRKYIRSGWFEPIGRGALIRTGQKVDWLGALFSIQNQLNAKIHIGGRTALNILGLSHYLELGEKKKILFAPRGTNLPDWFRHHNWNFEINLHKTDFLPFDTGLIPYEEKSFSVIISSPVRAMMECLYLAPQNFNLLEAYQIMEGLTAIHPKDIQLLLSECRSVKTVRLFLYMAFKAGHSWIKNVDLSGINSGKGKRSIVKKGIYISDFKITVPVELANA